jgi:hypothetical protein
MVCKKKKKFILVFEYIFRIGETAHKEYNETGSLGQETAKSTVIVGARWFGAFAGATVGNFAGSLIGNTT